GAGDAGGDQTPAGAAAGAEARVGRRGAAVRALPGQGPGATADGGGAGRRAGSSDKRYAVSPRRGRLPAAGGRPTSPPSQGVGARGRGRGGAGPGGGTGMAAFSGRQASRRPGR